MANITADGPFIADARQVVPELLAEVLRLRAELTSVYESPFWDGNSANYAEDRANNV